MTRSRRRLGTILKLERRPIDVDPMAQYQEIGIRSFGKGIFHKEPVSGLEIGNKRIFEIHPGDLLTSNVFAWEGAIAVAGGSELGRCGSHRFMTWVARNPDEVDLHYLCYFFLSDPGMKIIGKSSPGSAGRNRTLNIDLFEDHDILMPHITEQKAIATHLNAQLRHANEHDGLARVRGTLLDALPQSLGQPAHISEGALIKRGWERVPLGRFLTIEEDRACPLDPLGEYSIAGVYSFGRGMIDRGSLTGIDTKYSELFRIRTDDLVISRLGAWEGAVALVDTTLNGYFVSQEFPIFRVDSAVASPRFLRVLARCPRFWDELSGRTRGSMERRKRIHPERMLRVEVLLPSRKEQDSIAMRFDRVLQVVNRHSATQPAREALFYSILNQVFAEAS